MKMKASDSLKAFRSNLQAYASNSMQMKAYKILPY